MTNDSGGEMASSPSSHLVRAADGQHDLDWLPARLGEHRERGQRIVTVAGRFDLLHPGHVALLEGAKQQGNVLVVLLVTEPESHPPNDAQRPVNSEKDRATVLLALKAVDYVVLTGDRTPAEILNIIRPDAHYTSNGAGADEKQDASSLEANIGETGGKVETLPFLEGYSTSRIFERIRNGSPFASMETQTFVSTELTCRLDGRTVSHIATALRAGGHVLYQSAHDLSEHIVEAGRLLAETVRNGGRVLACGNGGSAADAQHFVAELVGRYRIERAPWKAIALTVDPSVVSSIGNDYGFNEVFARQVAAHGQSGDILLAITTSGESPNILRAVETAKTLGMHSIGLTGARDSALCRLADTTLQVPSLDTPLIQQAHIAILHLLCEIMELEVS